MEDANKKESIVARMLDLIDRSESGENAHKVEFFFYSRQIEWAHILANRLRSLGYEVQVTQSASSSLEYLINGWTTPMELEEDTVENWSETMTVLAAHCQCKFDGWGTFIG